MPFKSKRQLQTCFGRRLSAEAKGKKPSSWDCDRWLAETKSAECLPDTVSSFRKSSCSGKRKRLEYNDEEKFYRGARGGLYFYVRDIKVYVPADARTYVERKYKIHEE